MRITNTMAIALSMLTAAGCMHTQREEDGTSESARGQLNSNLAQATTPSETMEPLGQVERADKLIGQEVLTSDHLRTGKIEDFEIDQGSGRILYAIVGIGGVLGVGETRVAVPPGLFIEAREGSVQINVDKHKLTRAPQVSREAEKNVQAGFLNNVYGYYGQVASWRGTAGTPSASFNAARTATELKGMKIQNSAHQDLGTVEAVMLNVPASREIYVILSPTSDMNLGENHYALPPQAVKLSTDQKTLVADLTREKLANAPHFAKNDWSELSNTAWAQKVYRYYGQPGTFTTGELQPTGRTIQKR